MKVFLNLALLFSVVPTVFAQTLAERGTPLDHLAGEWVMTGTIAGQQIVHDLDAEWVLGGHYLFFHELARERDEHGNPAYESRVYFGWDEAGERLVCLWLDVTGGGGLVPDGLGYGKPEGDRIPFVWGEGEESQIHNTFSYQPESDSWTWEIDNVRQGEPHNFARVTLQREAGLAETMQCSGLMDAHLQSDMALDYEAFDQTPGQGFRELAGAGCYSEAADLIEAYREHNDAGERSLIWHIAQMRAMAGQNEAAAEAARQSLRDDEAGQGAFRWNDYVLATIAFLEKDRDALQHHRDAVAAGAHQHRGNAVNLKLLDALLRHFDRDYAYATSHIE